MNTSELPANQVALAQVLKGLAKRAKPYRKHLEDAENVMTVLRQRGFRLVPFPPLKSSERRKLVKSKKIVA